MPRVIPIVMRMTTSDEALATAAANGDGRAFALLLDRQYDRLFALCFRLTGNRAEAEDLTQDICAALPAKLASYKGQSRVTTWLYRVAVNAAHDRPRRQARPHAAGASPARRDERCALPVGFGAKHGILAGAVAALGPGAGKPPLSW